MNKVEVWVEEILGVEEIGKRDGVPVLSCMMIVSCGDERYTTTQHFNKKEWDIISRRGFYYMFESKEGT